MNILFFAYWGIRDGLTAATVFPHLEFLSGFGHIKKIILITIERDQEGNAHLFGSDSKIIHIPLTSKRPLPNIINKVYDFIDFPKKIEKICRQEQIDKIIARGAPPGSIAMKVSKKTNIPYYVESFEPHADYMLESGTWKWYDPRYIYQKKWEKAQLTSATALMPVADNYKEVLITKGVPREKIDVIPCCVPLERFRFNSHSREKIRKELGCGNFITGIYTGKFGGIYYRDESFLIFKTAFEYFRDQFFLIILSPDDPRWIAQMVAKYDLPDQQVVFLSVAHHEVPGYLSAADFAFTLIKSKLSNLYCSPIKNAEYWASGLPVLITEGVGDDDKIIGVENAGALFKDAKDVEGIESGLLKIEKLLGEKDIRLRLHKVAGKYRNFEIARNIYSKWYGKQ